MIVIDRLIVPLVAVTVIGEKLVPLETYNVTSGGWPAPFVSPLADVVRGPPFVKLARLSASVEIVHCTAAFAACCP